MSPDMAMRVALHHAAVAARKAIDQGDYPAEVAAQAVREYELYLARLGFMMLPVPRLVRVADAPTVNVANREEWARGWASGHNACRAKLMEAEPTHADPR